ncbi:hypothetical protein C8Q77DRAFT_452924 [Trametes polyzona]|nr:hypothetical protein C8Q77DRAFT_452924 [Trametes polyzona]
MAVPSESRRLRDSLNQWLSGEIEHLRERQREVLAHDRGADQYKAERDQALHLAARYRAERDDLLAAIRRYNPEVINRQEELHDTALVMQTHNPPSANAQRPAASTREFLRHGLSYLIPVQCASRNRERMSEVHEFRRWLTSRAIVPTSRYGTVLGGPISDNPNVFSFNKEQARLCLEPLLYIRDRLSWCTSLEHHGFIICPEFQYGPSLAYSGKTWTKVSEWRACAEQKREVFFEDDGEIMYAGTYLCHSGPSSLKVSELGDIKSEILIRALSKETRTAKDHKKIDAELVTIEQLYREGVLTVHIIGIERVGCNDALYTNLEKRYARQVQRRPYVPPAPLPRAPSSPYVEPYIPAGDYAYDAPVPQAYIVPAQYVPPAPPVAPAYVPPAPAVPRAPYVPAAQTSSYTQTSYANTAAAPATVPIAGPSRVAAAPVPLSTPTSSPLIPPPSYIANIQVRAKRTRDYEGDDDGFTGRASKYVRVSDPIVEPSGDDEGYLFYGGSDYYRRLLNGSDDEVSLGGEGSFYEHEDEVWVKEEEAEDQEDDEEEEEYEA